jgi:hypothetical protein
MVPLAPHLCQHLLLLFFVFCFAWLCFLLQPPHGYEVVAHCRLIGFCFLFLWDRVLLYSSGWPWTYDPFASASCVLRLWAGKTIPGSFIILECISLMAKIMLDIFSCSYWSFVYLLWKNVYSLTIFQLSCLPFGYWIVKVLTFNLLSKIWFANISSHSVGFFTF